MSGAARTDVRGSRRPSAWRIGTGMACLACGTALAQAPATHLTVQAEHQRLDRGLADWDELTLQLSRQWRPREVGELAAVRTRRFGLEDTQLRAGYSRPLTPALTGTLQASWSPSHKVLPQGSVGGALQYEFAPGWLAHGGARHTRYTATDVNQLNLALERYVGDFSFLAGWTPARALGQRTDAWELRANWYWRDDASVGLILARGEEAVQLGENRVGIADVRSIALVARAPLGPRLAVVGAAQRTRQGSFYTRTGASIGLRYAF